jgi:hypothetical protein
MGNVNSPHCYHTQAITVLRRRTEHGASEEIVTIQIGLGNMTNRDDHTAATTTRTW